ncbi:MAG: c-type cytochrome [Ginsengibacter sp.]
MKRSILLLAAFITFIAASLAFITADEPTYKNLKILKKNITKKELDSVMHFFSVSVGEKCGFCHVRNEAAKSMDFASDANPNKNVARYMMRMTAKLNKKYFKNMEKDSESKGSTIASVTCYTCHHGVGHPAIKAAAMPVEKMGGTPAGNMRPAMPDSAK